MRKIIGKRNLNLKKREIFFMSNSKETAFSLIELLAVIVILAIIALIATPLILNMIEKARKNAFLNSAYGIIDSVKLYYSESLLNGKNETAKIFSFDEDNNELTFGGSKPKGGMVAVSKEGKVNLAIHNGLWCAKKSETNSTITLSKYEINKCSLDSIADEIPDDPENEQSIESIMTDEKAGENGSIWLDNRGNKRYSGSNPNNYVCFGMIGDTCDQEHLYRIIGVFDKQIKIVKYSNYNLSKKWDSFEGKGSNNWNRPADLNLELNGDSFLENEKYIDKASRGYIVNATWYTGGPESGHYSLADFEYEERSTSSVGYIGLPSATDYGYASDHENCDRGTMLNESGNACNDKQSNYFASSSYSQWLITLYNGNSQSQFILLKIHLAILD